MEDTRKETEKKAGMKWLEGTEIERNRKKVEGGGDRRRSREVKKVDDRQRERKREGGRNGCNKKGEK